MVVSPCSLCNANPAKYRCPSCYISYCSLNCWKQHKEAPRSCPVEGRNILRPSEIKKENLYLDTDFITEDTVPPEKLEQLRYSEKLKKLCSDPHLRDLLGSVDSSRNSNKALCEAMKDSDFVNFVDECIRIVEPPE